MALTSVSNTLTSANRPSVASTIVQGACAVSVRASISSIARTYFS